MIDSFIDLAKSPMTQFTDYLIPVSNGIPNFDESVPTFISKIFFVCDRSSSLIIHWILFHLFFLKISFGFVKEITFVIGLLSRFACKVMGLSYNILDGLFILFLWVFALGFRIVFPTYSSCSNLIFLDWYPNLNAKCNHDHHHNHEFTITSRWMCKVKMKMSRYQLYCQL